MVWLCTKAHICQIHSGTLGGIPVLFHNRITDFGLGVPSSKVLVL
jgi:hypothetical protein